MKAGGFVFVAGLLAAHGEGDLGGIAPEAQVPEGHLWKGQRIQLELAYLLRQKLGPALAAAGSSLARVVKADVAITDLREVPAFNQVWARAFGGTVPATTFVPTVQPGLAITDARPEITLVALCDDRQGRVPFAADNSPPPKSGKMPPYHTNMRGLCRDSAPCILPARDFGVPVALRYAALWLAEPIHGVPPKVSPTSTPEVQTQTLHRTQSLRGSDVKTPLCRL